LVMNLFVGTAQVAVDSIPPGKSAAAGPPFMPSTGITVYDDAFLSMTTKTLHSVVCML